MAEVNATQRRAHSDTAYGIGEVGNIKCLAATIELAATTSGDTIDFGRIPTSARIIGGISQVYNDDLATSGSPTLDLGLAAVDSNLVNADDPDAIGNGHSLSAASAGTKIMTEIASIGLPAWDLVASESSDPGGMLKVTGTVKDAPTIATGTVSLELFYYHD